MTQDFVTVLDLGTTKAVCLAAESNGDSVKVKAIASTPCKALSKGIVADPDEAAKAINLVVGRVKQDLGQEIESLVVNIGGTHVECLNGHGLKHIVPRLRQITHQDVLEALNHSRSMVLSSDREQIQTLPREFRVDGKRDVRKPVGLNGSKLEALTYLITAQATAVQALEKAVTSSGYSLEQMVLTPLASGIGVLTPDEMEKGAAVIDIGAGSTEMAIFSGGTLAYSASIPIGAQYVTTDISKLLKTEIEEAERLKLEYGGAVAAEVSDRESVEVRQVDQAQTRPMQRRVLCEIIESRMRELAKMVHQQLTKAGYDTILPGGLVLTGGGAHLRDTEKLFASLSSPLSVRIAEPDLGTKFPNNTGMATAAGLARFALQCQDEVTPATGAPVWQDRVRSLFSMISGR